MPPLDSQQPDRPGSPNGFPNTRWTLVHRAVASGDEGAEAAFSDLCATYYDPILAVIRSRVRSDHDAEDLCQRFFMRLIDRNRFTTAAEKMGHVSLRAFLLQELKGFLIDHHRYSTAAKRDSSRDMSLDDGQISSASGHPELVEWDTPDREYDRKWRKALLSACMKSLSRIWEKRRAASPELPDFMEIAPLIGQSGDETQQAVSERLGINTNTLKSHLRNLRSDLRHLLHEHVAQTLINPSREAVLEELAALRLLDS